MQEDNPIDDFLTPEQRGALAALGQQVEYPPGDTIFREGTPSHSVVMLLGGSVRITKRDSDGGESELATRGVGEILGDEGVLADVPRSATITAVTKVVGIDVAAQKLVDFVDDHKLWRAFYRQAIGRRYESDDKRVSGSKHDARQKLVSYLLEQISRLGVREGDDWVLAGSSQADLAKAIGVSREAVAGALASLREEGLVKTSRRSVVVHDREGLRNVLSS